MALEEPYFTIVVIAINFVLFYISSAIMCGIMFRRDSRRWTWLNLIMAALISVAWVFGWGYLAGLGSATVITFGLVIFFLCYLVWVTIGGVGDRSAVYATLGTLILWFLFSWLLMVIFSLTGVTEFSTSDFPTLLSWLP